MNGTDEPSPPIRVPKQSVREVYVGHDLPARKKEPLPTIVTSSPPSRPFLTSNSRSSSITGDDVEAAFDAAFDEPRRDPPNVLFGLSTIDEERKSHSTNIKSPTTDDELDFSSYFNKAPPTLQELKSSLQTMTLNQSSEILTPSVSLTTKIESNSLALSDTQPTENFTDESVDEDVEELLGKLEVSVCGEYMHTHTHIHTYIQHTGVDHSLKIVSFFFSLLLACRGVCQCAHVFSSENLLSMRSETPVPFSACRVFAHP